MRLALALVAAGSISAQVGDPQIRTDHTYYPGELAMSSPDRAVAFAYAVPRGSLGSTARERVIELFLWRSEHFTHLDSPALWNLPGRPPSPVQDDALMADLDAMRALFSYGWALCGTNHSQMRVFADVAGFPSRRRGLNNDTGFELLVDGEWRYFNVDQYTLHFLADDPNAHFASLDQVITTPHRYIEWNPDLGLGYRLPQANTHDIYETYMGVTGPVQLRSQQWRDYYENVWALLPADSDKLYGEGYTAAPVVYRLRRGERFTRWYSPDGAPAELGIPGKLWWGFNGGNLSGADEAPFAYWSFVQNAPARDQSGGISPEVSAGRSRYGNGAFEWRPDLSRLEHLDAAAYVDGTFATGVAPLLRATSPAVLVFEHYSPYAIAARPLARNGSGNLDPAFPAADGAVLTATVSGAIEVDVSINAGATWTRTGTLTGAGARVDFTDRVKGRNAYWVRLNLDRAEGLDAIGLRTITMLSWGVYPNLHDGGTRVSYEAGGRGALDLSPDLWTASSARAALVADSGNLQPLHYAGGETYAYRSSDDQPISAVYRVALPRHLARQGAALEQVFAAIDGNVTVPPPMGQFSRIEIGPSAAGPWSMIAQGSVGVDNALSHFWTYGKTTGAPLGGTERYVRFTHFNGGFPSRIRYLRIYATYTAPPAGSPVTVTYHWAEGGGLSRSDNHVVAAGRTSDTWTVPTGAAVVQRKVAFEVASGTGNVPRFQPEVDAGPDRRVEIMRPLALAGHVSDPDSSPAIRWSVRVSPPGAMVVFSDAAAPATAATFDRTGAYVLELSADNVSDTVVVTVTPPLVTGTASFTSAADTYVDFFVPSSSFGGLDRLELRYYDEGTGLMEHSQVLLRFDVSALPAGAEVQSAVLRVYNTRAAANTERDLLQLLRVTEPWTEALAWAHGIPAARVTQAVLPSVEPYTRMPATPELYQVAGLADVVQLWADDPAGNHGLLFRTESNVNLRFTSREFADARYRPTLEVVYRAPISPNDPPRITGAIMVDPMVAGTGQTIRFTASAADDDAGPQPLSFTWIAADAPPGSARFSPNGTAEARTATASFTSAGTFNVRVEASDGLATATATVSVEIIGGPEIVRAPSDVTVDEGQVAVFSVEATSRNGRLLYFWARDGVAIPGATAASYETPRTTRADDGAAFTVTVSDGFASTTSGPALLTVEFDPAMPPPVFPDAGVALDAAAPVADAGTSMTTTEETSGCSCRASSTGNGGAALMFLLALGVQRVSFVRRRQSSRRS